MDCASMTNGYHGYDVEKQSCQSHAGSEEMVTLLVGIYRRLLPSRQCPESDCLF